MFSLGLPRCPAGTAGPLHILCCWAPGRVSAVRGPTGQQELGSWPQGPAPCLSQVIQLPGTQGLDFSWLLCSQGNIEFMETEQDGQQKGGLAVVEESLVDHVAELTATPRDLVLRSLLARTVASGGRELIEKGHSVAEASYARDACAKVPGSEGRGS